MKLTPIKFDAQYPDGVLQLEGQQFEWNGIKFAIHRMRPMYDHPRSPLCVSSVETGFSCCPVTARTNYVNAAKQAIAKLDKAGVEKVRAAIDKALATKAPSTRLTA